ncbi:hypothetical protein PM082_022482 [Marasmius tenuissimus]|nr:hypothetical protein PM082_022482 [Marasmius tenuissimus]
MNHREQYKRIDEVRRDEEQQCLDAMDVDAADTPSIRVSSPPPAVNSSRSHPLAPPPPPADNSYVREVTTMSKQRAREVPALIIPSTNSLGLFTLPLSPEPLRSSSDTANSALSLTDFRIQWSSTQEESPVTSYTASSSSPQSVLLGQETWVRAVRPRFQDVPRDATYDVELSGCLDRRSQMSKTVPSSSQYDADCTSFDDNGLYMLEEDGMSDSIWGKAIDDSRCKGEGLFVDLGSPITVDTPSSHVYDWPSFEPFMMCATTSKEGSSPSASIASSNGLPVHNPNMPTLSYPSDVDQQYPQYTLLSPLEYCPNTPFNDQQQRIRAVGSPAITRASRMRREPPNIHQCPHCESSFTALHNLKNHVNSHLGIKPHQCGKCGRSFGTRHVLTRHCKKLCRV